MPSLRIDYAIEKLTRILEPLAREESAHDYSGLTLRVPACGVQNQSPMSPHRACLGGFGPLHYVSLDSPNVVQKPNDH